jgi:hypothetical protein
MPILSLAILNQYGPRIGGGENNLEVRPLEYRDKFIKSNDD